MNKVIGIGETVTDIIIRNSKPQDMVCGGSCYNSMISLGRCATPAIFVGEVGDDRLGHLGRAFLKDNGVDTSFVQSTPGKKSQLSLAFLNEHNNADYVFYKDHASDIFPKRLPSVASGDVVLFGSFFAVNPTIHPALSSYVAQAKSSGAIVYYDVNFRASHLAEKASLQSQFNDNFQNASIVRGSDEDFQNIFDTDNTEAIYRRIYPLCDTLVITRGGNSLDIITPLVRKSYTVPPAKVVSTVGAGDSFNAGVVYSLISQGIDSIALSLLRPEQWDCIVATAMRFAAEVCATTENYISRQSGNFFSQQNTRI